MYSDNAGEVPGSPRPWGGIAQRSACLAGVVTGGVTCRLLRVEKETRARRDKGRKVPPSRLEQENERREDGEEGESQSQSARARLESPSHAQPGHRQRPSLSSSKQNPPLEGVGVAGLELWPSGDWSSQTALPAIHSHRERARVSSALAKTCMETRVTPTGYRRCSRSSFLTLFRKRG